MISLSGFAQAPHVHTPGDNHNHNHTADPNDHANHVTAPPSKKQLDSLLSIYKAPAAHAAKFGRLIIQDAGGRMKPVNTFSSELLRKVSHDDTYNGMNSDQVLLSMTQYAQVWIQVPIIYIKSGNDSIRKIIGVDKEAKAVAFVNFLMQTETTNFLLI